jgi:ABC-2 type transport system permease protein
MLRYPFIARTSARQQLTYRTELLMRAVSMATFMGVFVALWSTAFGVSGLGDLAGYSLPQVVWYLAMTETITLSGSRVFMEISQDVKEGNLAYTLARPLSYPLFQMANSLGNSAPRFFLNLATGALVVLVGVGRFAGSLPGLAGFLLLAALALVLDALVAVLIGLTAFWIEEVAPIYWIYNKLLFTVGGLFLPLEMFPGWLRRIADWLPFRFIAYAPARAFISGDPGFVLQALAGQLIYIALFAGVTALLWRAAQKRLVVHGG